jgi:Tfp pilus assembly protein PilF
MVQKKDSATLVGRALMVLALASTWPFVVNRLWLDLAAIEAIRTGFDATWTTNWSWNAGGRLLPTGRGTDALARPASRAAAQAVRDSIRTRVLELHDATASRLLAHLDYQAGDYVGSSENLATLVYNGAARPWESLGLAKLYESRGQHGLALDVLRLRQGMATPGLLLLASRSLEHGDSDTARRLAALAVEAVPESSEANRLLGHILVLHGTTQDAAERAVQVLTRGVNTDPSNGDLRINLAHALVKAGRYTEALVQLRTAVAQRPLDPTAHLLLGEAYRNQRDFAGAAREYLRCVELDPNQVWAFYGLGRVYAVQERNAEAATAWRHALEIDPTFQPASAALNSLR